MSSAEVITVSRSQATARVSPADGMVVGINYVLLPACSRSRASARVSPADSMVVGINYVLVPACSNEYEGDYVTSKKIRDGLLAQ